MVDLGILKSEHCTKTIILSFPAAIRAMALVKVPKGMIERMIELAYKLEGRYITPYLNKRDEHGNVEEVEGQEPEVEGSGLWDEVYPTQIKVVSPTSFKPALTRGKGTRIFLDISER